MCDVSHERGGYETVPVAEAVGMVLAHDITEIRKDEFKGRAFKKGHVIQTEDVCHLQRLGKERIYILRIAEDEVHEDDAAYALAGALSGAGVGIQGEPREGKLNLVAKHDGLLRVDREALLAFNMLGDVMCATMHDRSVVKAGATIAGTRAIPLVVKKDIVTEAVRIAKAAGGVLSVKAIRKPRAGLVITGNEVYHGRITDAFAPVIRKKIEAMGGEVVGLYYAPDDAAYISNRLRELLDAGADLLLTTGGMSVDPDDVTRFAVRGLGAEDICYGSAVLPGAMFMTARIGNVPVLGVPACGMYHATTVLDLILPRVLAGEGIGRRELAELGHGGLCLNCKECRYPICPFGKA